MEWRGEYGERYFLGRGPAPPGFPPYLWGHAHMEEGGTTVHAWVLVPGSIPVWPSLEGRLFRTDPEGRGPILRLYSYRSRSVEVVRLVSLFHMARKRVGMAVFERLARRVEGPHPEQPGEPSRGVQPRGRGLLLMR